ncbi:MAG TPA: DUF5615 family PIN-like protein [Candidatus Lokiarchaeia archaeon]|nr:DUF5615 family PIN-like protein [Candidatus Lokiarchaeia archaeon]
MNFLLDENVPSILKKVLREEGHIVSTLKDLDLSQLVNGELAKFAMERNNILITFDEDFILLKNEIKRKLKVIYFKFNKSNPELANNLLKKHLKTCLGFLRKPGIVTIEEEDISFLRS